MKLRTISRWVVALAGIVAIIMALHDHVSGAAKPTPLGPVQPHGLAAGESTAWTAAVDHHCASRGMRRGCVVLVGKGAPPPLGHATAGHIAASEIVVSW